MLSRLVPFGTSFARCSEQRDAVAKHHSVRRNAWLLWSETELVGISLLLEGVWHSEWEMSSRSIGSNLAMASLLPLSSAPIDLEQRGIRVRFIREAEGLLNGMDWATMSDENLAKKFLLNLVANTRVESEPLNAETEQEE